METSSIVLLVVSASISFALGRTILHFRNKKKKADTQKRAINALRHALPNAQSKNKRKRKRQMQQLKDLQKSTLNRE